MHYGAKLSRLGTTPWLMSTLMVLVLASGHGVAHGSGRRTLAFEPMESSVALPDGLDDAAQEAIRETLEEHSQLVITGSRRAQYRLRPRLRRLEEHDLAPAEHRVECEVDLVVESRRRGILAVLNGRAAARGQGPRVQERVLVAALRGALRNLPTALR